MQKLEIITGTITKPTAVTVGSLCKEYTKLHGIHPAEDRIV